MVLNLSLSSSAVHLNLSVFENLDSELLILTNETLNLNIFFDYEDQSQINQEKISGHFLVSKNLPHSP